MKHHHYTAPESKKSGFNCPLCNAYANQEWRNLQYYDSGYVTVPNLSIAECSHCGKISIWYKGKMVYPILISVPLPNQDLPNELQADYIEAANILQASPRSAAALCRLIIEKLCTHLGETKGNLNDKIGNLVSKGLPQRLQQALDIVRVTGNSAVHGGQIDLNDNSEIAISLFSLINMIAEKMITEPKEMDELYNIIPEGMRKKIEERDGKSGTGK